MYRVLLCLILATGLWADDLNQLNLQRGDDHQARGNASSAYGSYKYVKEGSAQYVEAREKMGAIKERAGDPVTANEHYLEAFQASNGSRIDLKNKAEALVAIFPTPTPDGVAAKLKEYRDSQFQEVSQAFQSGDCWKVVDSLPTLQQENNPHLAEALEMAGDCYPKLGARFENYNLNGMEAGDENEDVRAVKRIDAEQNKQHAIQCYEESARLRPAEAARINSKIANLKSAIVEGGKAELAAGHKFYAAKQWEKAVLTYEKVPYSSRYFPAAMEWSGYAYLQDRNFMRAVPCLRIAQERAPKPSVQALLKKWEPYYEAANDLVKAGQSAEDKLREKKRLLQRADETETESGRQVVLRLMAENDRAIEASKRYFRASKQRFLKLFPPAKLQKILETQGWEEL